MLRYIRLELAVGMLFVFSVTALVWVVTDSGAGGTTQSHTPASAGVREEPRSLPKGAIEVDIIGFDYEPEPVRVSVGQQIVWTNRDAVAHTVTSADESWDSGLMGQGHVFARSFDEPGVYTYICTLHPPHPSVRPGAESNAASAGGGGGMQGKVIVE